MVRISRASLLFSFFLSVPLFSMQEQNSVLSDTGAQQWLTEYIEQVKPEQVQITANLLYLLYANSVIELQVQQFFTPLTCLTQEIKTEILSYKNPVEKLATLKKLTERLSFIAGARTIYNQSLAQCVNFYNQNSMYTKKITPAINALQNTGQAILIGWANENNDDINQKIADCSIILTESAQYFSTTADFLKGINDGELSIEGEENTRALINLDTFLKSSNQATISTEKILNALNNQNDQIMALVTKSNEIYKQYYEAIYNHITSESFDKKYRKTMFGMYGLVPEEYQSELPNVKNVLEHVLQTIKLYTQVELSQQ